MSFGKFLIIIIISLVITLGYSYFKDWKIGNLQKTYNYNFQGIGFWSAFFMGEHSAGEVFLWEHYKNWVLFFTFSWIVVILYLITWKISDD